MNAPRKVAQRLGGLSALLASAVMCSSANAQVPDSTEIVAGPRYEASPLKQRLLGSDYRDVWLTPARVPILNLAVFGGGLTPVRRGGGEQTRALRLLGEDGREYNFRSVDKWVTPDPQEDLRDTPAEAFVQDQVSSLHPAAAVVATELLDAVGILHPGPRLVVMPDDPRLGEFRPEFAGMLGTIELHANEPDGGGRGFAGAVEVESEEDLFQALREDPANRVDARALLAERLMSLLMADWDRHSGQYRWARFDSAATHRWVPVPEDRDYAFADYDGLIFRLAGFIFPEGAPFSARYRSDLSGLMQNSAEVDRRLLTELAWPEWARIATGLQAALTDEVIEDAVRTMPREYFDASGPELIRILRARRDGLHDAALRFYLVLAREPEVHATDASEHAEIMRFPDGSVRVSLSAAAASPAKDHFQRTFHPDETREIRLYLYGGSDRAVLRGEASHGPLVRVIGGLGADTLRDLSAVQGPELRTAFHDDHGDNVITAGRETVVDRARYEEPEWIPAEVLPQRDWGRSMSWFVPWATFEGTQGLLVGGGPQWTWYGFRRFPFAGRAQLRGMYGPRTGDFGVEGSAEFRGVGSAPHVWLHAQVSALEDFRFQGLGNSSPREDAVEGEIVHVTRSLAEARLRYHPVDVLSLGIGPVIERLDPDPDAAALDRLPANAREAYGKAGISADVSLDTRTERGPRSGGFRLEAEGSFFPRAWDLSAPFTRVGAEAAGYAPLPLGSLLAIRAGGARVLGDAPLADLVRLGGSETLRGFPYQRFTGDALLYGGLETRVALMRAKLLVRGDLGVLAFADAGRVYVDGDSEGDWHRGYGAGLWFGSLGRAVSVTYARGEGDQIHLKLGMPF